MRAVVLETAGRPPVVRDDVELLEPGRGEVRVVVRAASLCHSDLHAIDGQVPVDLPLVLGHEAAGTVAACGPGVDDLAPGQPVVFAMVPICGACRRCGAGRPSLCELTATLRRGARFRIAGSPASGFLGLGTLTEEVVVRRESLVPAPPDCPMELLSLLGCGAMTGIGAVLHAGQVQRGDAVLVVGGGTVGLAAVMAAAFVGADPIVLSDPVVGKREIALTLGATAAIHPDDLPETTADVSATGFDVAVEAVGLPVATRSAWDATRRGGTLVCLGGGPDAHVTFDLRELFVTGRTIRGSVYGDVDLRRDLKTAVSAWRSGRLPLETLVDRRISLAETPAALTTLREGRALRIVIRPQTP